MRLTLGQLNLIIHSLRVGESEAGWDGAADALADSIVRFFQSERVNGSPDLSGDDKPAAMIIAAND